MWLTRYLFTQTSNPFQTRFAISESKILPKRAKKETIRQWIPTKLKQDFQSQIFLASIEHKPNNQKTLTTDIS